MTGFSGFDKMLQISLPTFSMPRFGLNSVLDILVLGAVIYYVMMWIRQTRGWTLMRGIGILLIVAALSYILELSVVMWLISNMFSVGLIVIIVIFQPEMRKALERLGNGRIASVFRSSDDTSPSALTAHSAAEIVEACVKMAKVKTGALIIIEQKVPLGDIESTGIVVDAAVTYQLLINIFEHNTPLHDGAVIVRNNRVSAASCICPLTQAPLASELGTRHRAGVGASEVSDAVVVIVSEETGAVSVANEGKLRRDITRDELMDRIAPGERAGNKRRSRLWKGADGR